MIRQYLSTNNLFEIYHSCNKDVKSSGIQLLHLLSPNTNHNDLLIEEAIKIIRTHAQRRNDDFEKWRKKDFSRRVELFSTFVPIDNLLNLIQHSTENKKRKTTESMQSFHDLTTRQKRYKTDENVEYLKNAASQNSLNHK